MNLPIKIGRTIKCKNCENNFQTGRKHGGKIYCSRECWKIHWKGKNTHMFGKHLSDVAKEKISKLHIGNQYNVGKKSWNSGIKFLAITG